MSLGQFLVVFTSSWWILFFIILPIGVDTNYKIEKGNADSAPKNPNIIKKMLITTILSLLFTFIMITLSNYFNFEKILEKFLGI